MFNQGNGVYVGDMFGSLADDPLLRAAREANYDQTQADAEYEARTAPRESVNMWGTPGRVMETQAPGLRAWETNESVRRDIFGGQPAAAPLPEGVKLGTSYWDRDPFSGEMVMKAQAPDNSAAKERQAIAAAERRKVGRELEMNQTALLKLKPTNDQGKKDPGYDEARRLILRNLVGLEEKWRALGNVGAAPATTASDSDNAMWPESRMFAGEPGATDNWMTDWPTPATGTKNAFDRGVESISGGAAAAPGAGSKSPYPEGFRLRGKDGRRYVVKNGQPVPL